jgi:ribosomal protein L29
MSKSSGTGGDAATGVARRVRKAVAGAATVEQEQEQRGEGGRSN